MNKAELIDEVQSRLGAETSKAAAERAVDAVLEAVGQGIRRDREVQLVQCLHGAVVLREPDRFDQCHLWSCSSLGSSA